MNRWYVGKSVQSTEKRKGMKDEKSLDLEVPLFVIQKDGKEDMKGSKAQRVEQRGPSSNIKRSPGV